MNRLMTFLPSALFTFALLSTFNSYANTLFITGAVTNPGCNNDVNSGQVILNCRNTPSIQREIRLRDINEGDTSFMGVTVKIRNLGKDTLNKIVLLDYN